jgi:hypothetical protein
MRPFLYPLIVLLPVLGACSVGNVETASNYHAPAAPPLRHPYYDPTAAYGSSNATWTPPVYDRDGTIVRPAEPTTTIGRPDYEHAEWATGAAGGSAAAPPGTF